MLNASWLETFTTLCQTGHFTRTAQRLNMTQPGVSQHLRKLERQVGQPLLTRTGKSFALTPAGEAVFALGRTRRDQEARLHEIIDVDDPDMGEARIACSGSFATLLYSRARSWMAKAPRLSLHLEAAPRDAVLSGVLEGRFDLGILTEEPDQPRITSRFLGREEVCLVLPAMAPSATPGFAELEDRGFVAHPDGYGYAEELFALNYPDDFTGSDRLRIRAYVNQIGQIPAPVADGIGYTLLPRSAVDAFAHRDRLRIGALPRRSWHDLWLIQRRGRVLPARLSRLADLAAEVAEGLS